MRSDNRGTGRKKINIKKIGKNVYRKSTFTKRRKGLFKKAKEICDISSAEIAVVTFSAAERPFTFGIPSVDPVVDRFLAPYGSRGTTSGDGGSRPLDLDLNKAPEGEDEGPEDGDLNQRAEEEGDKKVGEEEFRWEEAVKELELAEVLRFEALIRESKRKVCNQLDEIKMRETCTKDFLALNSL